MSAMVEITYNEEWRYKHRNPYHERLSEFDEFVLRDHEAEELGGPWNDLVFKRSAPLCVEVGSGYGHFMRDYCQKYPDENFVGMDYRFKRSFNLARQLAKNPNKNFRYLRARGERTPYMFAENEVDKVFYFFPDPWPKKRHWKKRLFQEPFLQGVYKILKPGGMLFVKTDHDGYADWMREVIAQQDLFTVEFETNDLHLEFPDHFLARHTTKFEKIFIGKGVNIKAFVLKSRKEG